MGKKIAQIILAFAIVGLVYLVYDLISTPIKFEKEKQEKEAKIIERIKDIRTAQRAYKTKYHKFTSNFDTLALFITNDTLILERRVVDEDDSMGMANLKKLGKKNVEQFNIAVIDTIFSPKSFKIADAKKLRFIPGTNGQAEFILEAGTFETDSKVVVPIIECRVPFKIYLDTIAYRQEIINLIDDQVHNFNRYPGIKFGSMTGGNNEAGNWE